jgi:formylglycine-generating enzyme required for sulfatase activity
MAVVPAGSFTMGSPETEKNHKSWEGPQHIVTITKPFAVGKLHVTVDQFAAFVRETRYEASSKCDTYEDGKWGVRPGRSWRDPRFVQEGTHPVVCVSWDDAIAYVVWLAKKTRQPYRLLSEAEWEYAARGRTAPGPYPPFWFGDDEKELCRYGNGADQKAQDTTDAVKGRPGAPCDDGYAYTSPAGHFEPNAFGLYDMLGNAWQWTADCYHDSYNGAPTDGSAWTAGNCGGRIVRGGAWFVSPGHLRAAARFGNPEDGNPSGFRVARALTP